MPAPLVSIIALTALTNQRRHRDVAIGLFGDMGGGAMIGQTMINLKTSVARTQLSTSLAGPFLMIPVHRVRPGRARHPDGPQRRTHRRPLTRRPVRLTSPGQLSYLFEQMRPYRLRTVAVHQAIISLQRPEHRETRTRTMHLGNRDRSAEHDHWARRALGEHVLQRQDLRPIRVLCAGGLVVHRGNGRLQLVLPDRPGAERPFRQGRTFDDRRGIPLGSALFGERHEYAVLRYRNGIRQGWTSIKCVDTIACYGSTTQADVDGNQEWCTVIEGSSYLPGYGGRSLAAKKCETNSW
ncbi:hypothetical protein ACIRG5_25435 [Lentzea sp. NPDC102401]|uniref:hypothetical protein n=1 Tax=Lentzea sp. NPDC102401 TaxID=3364128 RepID=UPI0038253DFC